MINEDSGDESESEVGLSINRENVGTREQVRERERESKRESKRMSEKERERETETETEPGKVRGSKRKTKREKKKEAMDMILWSYCSALPRKKQVRSKVKHGSDYSSAEWRQGR